MSDTLNIENEIKIIDENLEVLNWNIERAEALNRLLNGTPKKGDFHIVMIEGFLEIEANRVFSLLTHPLTIKPEDKNSYLSQLDTVKNLSRYLGSPEYKGTINIVAANSKMDVDALTKQKQDLLAGKGE
jgi:hypothetical protein